MSIPESQLETWSHQGSITQSSSTYATIRTALNAADTGYAGKDFEVFLQGSYGNDTNIYSESDVDVVIRLDSTFHHDLTSLPAEQVAGFTAAHTDAPYRYAEFKAHVQTALEKSFGQSVKPGKRAIKLVAAGGRRDADVVVATQYRRYHRFISMSDQRYDLGICFFTADGIRIANYPKYHSENCTAKHKGTNQWFKPMVRIFKNMRGKLVDDGVIDKKLAPSYFIEGLLYNVPEDKFKSSYGDTFVACWNWLHNADRTKFVCPNNQYYLLGDLMVTWPAPDCDKFLESVKDLWNNWS